MATAQHYIWASGHFILLASAFRILVASILLKTISTWWYRASFTGALISYAIVCQKSLGTPQPNLTYIKRALLDENVQYFLLAFFWWSSKPVRIALLPYAIFSLFHALTFTRTTLMPQFLPPGPPATAGGPPQPHIIARKLQAWVKANYDSAMRAVAYIELLIFVRIIVGTLLLRNALVSPIIYGHFLRQRYYQSGFTREAIGVTKRRIDGFVRRDGMPPMLTTVWEKVLMLIERWTGTVLTPAPGATGSPSSSGRR